MSRARDLSRLSSPTNFTADGTTNRVGLGSENPTAKLNVAGIVSATAFYGDGSNLEGVASAGLGTAIAESGPGSVIYYTDKILGIAGNITVDVPDASNSNVAYTQYEEISVESGIDFIVADGDDFVPDILGLSTAGTTPLSGAGGRVRADNFTNKAGTGAPTFQTGVVVTGVATATTFSGNATGLTGTPDITVRNIIGVGATLSGVLTYEDVTNIDSVGVVTARGGFEIGVSGVGGTITAVGNAEFSGIVTATSFSGSGANLTGIDAAPSFSATADGALTNGQTVVIQSDGTVKAVGAAASNQAVGSTVATFNSSTVEKSDMCYDPDNKKIIIAYKDSGNSAKVVAGTVNSNNTITFGTVTTLAQVTGDVAVSYDPANDRIFVVYQTGSTVVARAGTISGTTIAFPSSATTIFSSDMSEVKIAYNPDDERHYVVLRKQSGNTLNFITCEISGTSVTKRNNKDDHASDVDFIDCAYDPTSKRAVSYTHLTLPTNREV